MGQSWKQVVLQVMKHPNCKAVLCFVSKFSLMSDVIKYELDTTRNVSVTGTHYQKNLSILPIEVTNISEFCSNLVAECAFDEFDSEFPGEGVYSPSENVIYLQNKYFFDSSIMHYRILINQI